jgi:hypothetical protein
LSISRIDAGIFELLGKEGCRFSKAEVDKVYLIVGLIYLLVAFKRAMFGGVCSSAFLVASFR